MTWLLAGLGVLLILASGFLIWKLRLGDEPRGRVLSYPARAQTRIVPFPVGDDGTVNDSGVDVPRGSRAMEWRAEVRRRVQAHRAQTGVRR